MDDLFQGYMVLGAIGDFLEDDALVNHSKQPAIMPQPEHHAQPSNHVSPTTRPDLLDQHGRGVLVYNSRPEASTGSRQRRGHTKSRLGCLGCKRRKIKCQETWPTCANCDRRGLLCRYPDIFKHARHELAAPRIPSPCQVTQLSDTPIVYSPDDMQLFHHYLTAAYPCVPHDRDEVWIREVPLKSHQYPYLMDAMLALAGSHLALQVENPNNNLALRHRQRAIRGLEDAFARWPPSADESHVMFATSFLLSIQCSFMSDGFLEHFLSLRGCSLLSQLIVTKGFKGPFVEQSGLNLIPVTITFNNFLKLDQGLICEALLSLKEISHLVSRPDTHPIERAIVEQLVTTLRCLLHSGVQSKSEESAVPDLPDTTSQSWSTSTSTEPSNSVTSTNPLLPAQLADNLQEIDWENITIPPAGSPFPFTSFQAMRAILGIFATWPHKAILHIFDPKNNLGNVVMAHFSAIRFILSPLAAPKKSLQTPTGAIIQWSANIIATIDDSDQSGEWAQYVKWPRKIVACMQACVEKNRGFTTGDVRDMFIRDPGAFKDERDNYITVR